MDRLWAPWRLEYVAADPATKKQAPENFIVYADGACADRENLVVLRTDFSIVILNRFPYNNGHVLVAPRRAAPNLEDLDDAELLDVQKTLTAVVSALRTLMRPDGFNIGLNLGRAAGAGLPQHLHWHVVPRWSGDVNYMTVTGDARVIVQSLDALWLMLREHFGLPTS